MYERKDRINLLIEIKRTLRKDAKLFLFDDIEFSLVEHELLDTSDLLFIRWGNVIRFGCEIFKEFDEAGWHAEVIRPQLDAWLQLYTTRMYMVLRPIKPAHN